MSNTAKATVQFTRAELSAVISALAYYDTMVDDFENDNSDEISFTAGEIRTYRRASRKIVNAYQSITPKTTEAN